MCIRSGGFPAHQNRIHKQYCSTRMSEQRDLPRISPQQEKVYSPEQNTHAQSVALNRGVWRQKWDVMWEKASYDDEFASGAELYTVYEAYAFNVDKPEVDSALKRMDRMVESLEQLREKKGEMVMLKNLVAYVCRTTHYDFVQNSIIAAFSKEPVANCAGLAKTFAVLLEQLGYNPDTEIKFEFFKYHQRALVQAEGKWWVVEGFEITPYTPTPGTALIPFTDAKRMLMQLPPEEAEFIPEEKGKKDSPLQQAIDWITDAAFDVFPNAVEDNIQLPRTAHSEGGIMPLLHSIIPRVRVLPDFSRNSSFPSPKNVFTKKRLAVLAAAAATLYGGKQVADANWHAPEAVKDIATEIQKRGEEVQEKAEALVEELFELLKPEGDADKNDSQQDELNAKDRQKKSQDTPLIVTMVTPEELEKRQQENEKQLEPYFGLKDFLFMDASMVQLSVDSVHPRPPHSEGGVPLFPVISIDVGDKRYLTETMLRYIVFNPDPVLIQVQQMYPEQIKKIERYYILNFVGPKLQLNPQTVQSIPAKPVNSDAQIRQLRVNGAILYTPPANFSWLNDR